MASVPPTALRQPPPLHHRVSDDEEDEKKGNKPMPVSLPTELLFEILASLPADFLHEKARLVCPKWNKIIHTQAFIKSQLSHSSYGLVLSSRLVGSAPIYMTATRGRFEASELSYKCKTDINYITSCCGKGLAVFLSTVNDTLHVVNPATKQSLLIPSRPVEIRMPFCTDAGMAYSAASMEYKLILPYAVSHDDMYPFPQRLSLAILTVGVDKSWRHVRVDHLHKDARGLLSLSPLTTEGFFHWGSRGRHFLTLNVETEIFTYIQAPRPSLPPPKYRYIYAYCTCKYYYLSTGRYLTVLISCGKYPWQVWEMKPETGEWRKPVHDIELEDQMQRLRSFSKGKPLGSKGPDEVLKPLGWVKYPEVLAFYFKGDSCTCIFYNLDTREISTVKLPESCIDYRAFPHRHSLEWLS